MSRIAPAATSAFAGSSLGKSLLFALGGLGVAGLENKFVGDNLPAPLKAVNGGIGALTGLMLASKHPGMQTAALTSIPAKEMALFGLGGLDKFRETQQNLTDTNLHTARLNESAADANARGAGGKRLLAAAFLIPALAAGGALSANAYMNWKKEHKPRSKFKTDGSMGTPRSSQRVRFDMPPSALPKSFYKQLAQATADPRDLARLQTKSSNMEKPYLLKSAVFNVDHPLLSGLGQIGWASTGIPNLRNAWNDAGYSANTAQQGDYNNAARYGGSAAANAALGLLALRFGGAGLAAKLFGRGRITGVIRNQMAADAAPLGSTLLNPSKWGPALRRQMTELPTVAKGINRYGNSDRLGPMHLSPDAPGAALAGEGGYISGADRMSRRGALGMRTATPMRRALDLKGRYDPTRYAWVNPSTGNPLFKGMFSYSGKARSLPGHAIDVGRYAVNRGVNAAYAAKQWTKRHPIISSSLALPGIAVSGSVADAEHQRQAEQDPTRPVYMDTSRNAPSGNYMPASTIAGSLLSSFGGGNMMSPIRNQFGGM